MEYQWSEFVLWLKDRMAKPLPGYESQKKMMNVNRPDGSHAPATARQSGVLVLLYPYQNTVRVVLIERSADGGVHSGQVAFPGGRKEDSDIDIIATALREANEEVDLNPLSVEVLGLLSTLYIPVSNFVVNPVIAISNQVPQLKASEAEVASILHLDLATMFDRKENVEVKASGLNMSVHVIAYMMDHGNFIWGATAMILSELETMLNE